MPPPPPVPMFEADSQTFASAPSVPRGFTLQNVRPAFGGAHRGTLGGGGGGPSQPPYPPSDPLLPSGGHLHHTPMSCGGGGGAPNWGCLYDGAGPSRSVCSKNPTAKPEDYARVPPHGPDRRRFTIPHFALKPEGLLHVRLSL